MIVPDHIRKCVAFLGLKMADGRFSPRGSVFFLGRVGEEGTSLTFYAVTARHVIEGIRRTGVDAAWIRMNMKDKLPALYRAKLDRWFCHPTDGSIDVSILQMGFPYDCDHLVLPYSRGIKDDTAKAHEIGIGDEVFITGLFHHHYGVGRNIPILRVGNLACVDEEKMPTEYGLMAAYLIEARSIGGLSGSPVFINLGVTRMIGGHVSHAIGREPIYFLLGLMHGHYDTNQNDVDALSPDSSSLSPPQINMGIAICVPFHSIDEVIMTYENRLRQSPDERV